MSRVTCDSKGAQLARDETGYQTNIIYPSHIVEVSCWDCGRPLVHPRFMSPLCSVNVRTPDAVTVIVPCV